MVDWTQYFPAIKDVLAITGSLCLLLAAMWTVFRPFTRERIYGLLWSGKETHRAFVFEVIGDPQMRAPLAQIIAQTIDDEAHAPRFKEIARGQWEDELNDVKKTAHNVAELGRMIGQTIERSERLDALAQDLVRSQQHQATSYAVMAKTLEHMGTTLNEIRGEVAVTMKKVDRTQEQLWNRGNKNE